MRNDLDLRRDVVDELEWEPSLDAAGIGVGAHEGIVTLTGAVKSYTEKLNAEHAVRRVRGVRAIANDLDVQLPGHAHRNDTDIAAAAGDALNWKTSVPRDRIKVSVSKGRITLEGEVEWQYQSDAALAAVHHLSGSSGKRTNGSGLT